MPDSDIPIQVLEFISEHITSMEQLEVLLLVSSHPDKEWSVEEVFAKIQSSQTSVTSRLDELFEKGFLIQPQTLVFRYAPKNEEIVSTVRALAAVYKERHIKVIELIYRKQIDKVQSFADAFRIRKDNPNA